MASKEDNAKISFRISVEEKNALARYADANDLTVSQVIRRAIKEYLKEDKE